MVVCSACGRESPEGFRFCGSCGASLTTDAPISLAKLHSMQGKPPEADALRERARQAMENHGETVWLTVMELAEIPLDQGDGVSAERELRPAYVALKRMDEKTHFSMVAGLLSNAIYLQRRYEEAEELTRECEQAARANDVGAQIDWRAARAKVIARRGQLDAAESLAREAVAFAAESDFLKDHGHALVALAEVLELADRPAEAAAAVEEAVARYEQKGDLVSATKARALRAELRESIPQ